MLAYMRGNSLEIRIAGCSCRPQLLLLLFAGFFLKNFYNPVLQARFLELGGGNTRYKPTLFYSESYKYWFCFKQYFFKKTFCHTVPKRNARIHCGVMMWNLHLSVLQYNYYCVKILER